MFQQESPSKINFKLEDHFKVNFGDDVPYKEIEYNLFYILFVNSPLQDLLQTENLKEIMQKDNLTWILTWKLAVFRMPFNSKANDIARRSCKITDTYGHL